MAANAPLNNPVPFQNLPAHFHLDDDVCPTCQQPIPHERFDEIKALIESRELQRNAEVEARLQEKYEQQNVATLMVAKEAAAVQIANARDEERKKAEIEAKQRANATSKAHEVTISELTSRMAQVELERSAAVKGVESLQQNFDNRLEEQREALEKDKVAEINRLQSAAFEENQKLQNQFADMQRKLEKKTNEELGEGAEIDLYEALKTEFDGDRIERVNKGQPGADILHTVMHNGNACGQIIYDSKNHKAWRNEFVEKLATDKMAAKAEHAILSTGKFPAGTHQLAVQSGVIIANPARVVVLVHLFRVHLLQTHKLRASSTERSKKTAELYDFIISERCNSLLSRIDAQTDALLEIQVKEKRAHEAVWKSQGEMLRSVHRAKADLCHEIDGIIHASDHLDTKERNVEHSS